MVVKKGRILSHPYRNWEIVIDDDREGETGGYYLYIKKDKEGYDYWFEYLEHLENQLLDFHVIWEKDFYPSAFKK